MARGDRQLGLTEGVHYLAVFETQLHMLALRDGEVDPQEEAVLDTFRDLLTGFCEYESRMTILFSSAKGFEAPPARITELVADHENRFNIPVFESIAAD